MKYVKNVSEPWFTLIGEGVKTVEGRLCKGDFAQISIGDTIVWTNDEIGEIIRSVKTQVVDIRHYSSFKKYLQSETLKKCLPTPGIRTIKQGVAVYRQFYSTQMEKEFGICAIHIKRL